MNYPKKVMSRKALISQMGFTEAFLMRAFSTPGQTFAWRENPLNKHSPIPRRAGFRQNPHHFKTVVVLMTHACYTAMVREDRLSDLKAGANADHRLMAAFKNATGFKRASTS